MSSLRGYLITASVVLAGTAQAGTLPKDVPLPPMAKLNADTLSERNYDELDAAPAKKKLRGHAVRTYLSYVPEGSSPSAATVWSAWKPLLEKAGWKVAADDGNAQVGDFHDAPSAPNGPLYQRMK